MANAFKLKTFGGGSTGAATAMTVYTGKSSTETTIIGMSIANISTSQILVSVNIESDTSDTETNANVFVIKDAPIPAGGALQVLDGGAKIVVQSGDRLYVKSNTASSVDVWVSRVDQISA